MNDEYFMTEALKEAQKAFDIDEVPIGAVIEHKGEINEKTDENKHKTKNFNICFNIGMYCNTYFIGSFPKFFKTYKNSNGIHCCTIAGRYE